MFWKSLTDPPDLYVALSKPDQIEDHADEYLCPQDGHTGIPNDYTILTIQRHTYTFQHRPLERQMLVPKFMSKCSFRAK